MPWDLHAPYKIESGPEGRRLSLLRRVSLMGSPRVVCSSYATSLAIRMAAQVARPRSVLVFFVRTKTGMEKEVARRFLHHSPA